MKKRSLKIWAGAVLICFTLSSIGLPSQGEAAVFSNLPGSGEIQVSTPFQLEIPSELGTIETITSGTGPTVIHIQEAHGDYEGQRKILKILQYLKKKYGMKQVFLEGTPFQLHQDLVHLFPQDSRRTMTALDRLAKKSLASAPELFLALTPEAKVFGIEDLNTYVENSHAFVTVLRQKEKTEKFIQKMDVQMKSLGSSYLNPELRAFLDRTEDYEFQRISVTDWLETLKGQAEKKLSIDLSNPWYQKDWPMILRIFTLKKLEAEFDLSAFEKEKEAFLRALLRFVPESSRGGLDTERIRQMLASGLSQNHLPHPETGLLFEQMVSSLPPDFNYSLFPHVNQFIGRLILQSELDGTRLVSEMDHLSALITEHLAKTEEEKKIIQIFKQRRLLKRLFALELTPEDYEEMKKAGPQELTPSVLVRDLLELNASNRVRDVSFEHLREIDALYQDAAEFYRLAKERDGKMLERVENRFKETGDLKAVVITGGFHARPFAEYFKERGFNYALITPKIKNADTHTAYVPLFLKSFRSSPENKSTLKDIPYVATDPRTEMRQLGRDPQVVTAMITQALSGISEVRNFPARRRSEGREELAVPVIRRQIEGPLESELILTEAFASQLDKKDFERIKQIVTHGDDLKVIAEAGGVLVGTSVKEKRTVMLELRKPVTIQGKAYRFLKMKGVLVPQKGGVEILNLAAAGQPTKSFWMEQGRPVWKETKTKPRGGMKGQSAQTEFFQYLLIRAEKGFEDLNAPGGYGVFTNKFFVYSKPDTQEEVTEKLSYELVLMEDDDDVRMGRLVPRRMNDFIQRHLVTNAGKKGSDKEYALRKMDSSELTQLKTWLEDATAQYARVLRKFNQKASHGMPTNVNVTFRNGIAQMDDLSDMNLHQNVEPGDRLGYLVSDFALAFSMVGRIYKSPVENEGQLEYENSYESLVEEILRRADIDLAEVFVRNYFQNTFSNQKWASTFDAIRHKKTPTAYGRLTDEDPIKIAFQTLPKEKTLLESPERVIKLFEEEFSAELAIPFKPKEVILDVRAENRDLGVPSESMQGRAFESLFFKDSKLKSIIKRTELVSAGNSLEGTLVTDFGDIQFKTVWNQKKVDSLIQVILNPQLRSAVSRELLRLWLIYFKNEGIQRVDFGFFRPAAGRFFTEVFTDWLVHPEDLNAMKTEDGLSLDLNALDIEKMEGELYNSRPLDSWPSEQSLEKEWEEVQRDSRRFLMQRSVFYLEQARAIHLLPAVYRTLSGRDLKAALSMNDLAEWSSKSRANPLYAISKQVDQDLRRVSTKTEMRSVITSRSQLEADLGEEDGLRSSDPILFWKEKRPSKAVLPVRLTRQEISKAKQVLGVMREAVKGTKRTKAERSWNIDGVFKPASVYRLLRILKMLQTKSGQTLFDAGHGTGRVLFLAQIIFGFIGSGAEASTYLFRKSRIAQIILQEGGLLLADTVTLFLGNFLSRSWEDKDLIFYYSFGSNSQAELQEKLIRELKVGGQFILLGEQEKEFDWTGYDDFSGLLETGDFQLERYPELGVWIFTRIRRSEMRQPLNASSVETYRSRAEARKVQPVTINGKRYVFESQPQGEMAVGVTDPRAVDMGFPAGRQVKRYSNFYRFMMRVIGDNPPPYLPELRRDQREALNLALDMSKRSLGTRPFDQLWNSMPRSEREAIDIVVGTFFNDAELELSKRPDLSLSAAEKRKKSMIGTANYYLKLFTIRFLKDSQFRQAAADYLRSQRGQWQNPELSRRFVPMQFNSILSMMSNGTEGVVVPEKEIGSLLKLLKANQYLNRRLAFLDYNGRWGKDLQNALPEIPGIERYVLKHPGRIELPVVEFQRLFDPAAVQKFEKIGMIQEGGTSISGVAQTPFIVLSDSIPQKAIDDFKQAAARLPGYENLKVYVFPSGYVPFQAEGELLFLANDHIDTVMSFWPGSFLQDGRPALWISPEYHQELELRQETEWKRFLEEQKVRVVDIHPDEVKYAPANILQAGPAIFTNYAPRSLEALNIKPGANVFSIPTAEEAMQVIHSMGGSLGCLGLVEPVTADNVQQYPLREGSAVMRSEAGYGKTLQSQGGQSWTISVGDVLLSPDQNQKMQVIAIAEDGLSFNTQMVLPDGRLDSYSHTIIRPFYAPFFQAFPGRAENRDDVTRITVRANTSTNRTGTTPKRLDAAYPFLGKILGLVTTGSEDRLPERVTFYDVGMGSGVTRDDSVYKQIEGYPGGFIIPRFTKHLIETFGVKHVTAVGTDTEDWIVRKAKSVMRTTLSETFEGNPPGPEQFQFLSVQSDFSEGVKPGQGELPLADLMIAANVLRNFRLDAEQKRHVIDGMRRQLSPRGVLVIISNADIEEIYFKEGDPVRIGPYGDAASILKEVLRQRALETSLPDSASPHSEMRTAESAEGLTVQLQTLIVQFFTQRVKGYANMGWVPRADDFSPLEAAARAIQEFPSRFLGPLFLRRAQTLNFSLEEYYEAFRSAVENKLGGLDLSRERTFYIENFQQYMRGMQGIRKTVNFDMPDLRASLPLKETLKKLVRKRLESKTAVSPMRFRFLSLGDSHELRNTVNLLEAVLKDVLTDPELQAIRRQRSLADLQQLAAFLNFHFEFFDLRKERLQNAEAVLKELTGQYRWLRPETHFEFLNANLNDSFSLWGSEDSAWIIARNLFAPHITHHFLGAVADSLEEGGILITDGQDGEYVRDWAKLDFIPLESQLSMGIRSVQIPVDIFVRTLDENRAESRWGKEAVGAWFYWVPSVLASMSAAGILSGFNFSQSVMIGGTAAFLYLAGGFTLQFFLWKAKEERRFKKFLQFFSSAVTEIAQGDFASISFLSEKKGHRIHMILHGNSPFKYTLSELNLEAQRVGIPTAVTFSEETGSWSYSFSPGLRQYRRMRDAVYHSENRQDWHKRRKENVRTRGENRQSAAMFEIKLPPAQIKSEQRNLGVFSGEIPGQEIAGRIAEYQALGIISEQGFLLQEIGSEVMMMIPMYVVKGKRFLFFDRAGQHQSAFIDTEDPVWPASIFISEAVFEEMEKDGDLFIPLQKQLNQLFGITDEGIDQNTLEAAERKLTAVLQKHEEEELQGKPYQPRGDIPALLLAVLAVPFLIVYYLPRVLFYVAALYFKVMAFFLNEFFFFMLGNPVSRWISSRLMSRPSDYYLWRYKNYLHTRRELQDESAPGRQRRVENLIETIREIENTETRDADDYDLLEESLFDPHGFVRQAAAQALGKLSPASWVVKDLLLLSKYDTHRPVRAAASEAIRQINEKGTAFRAETRRAFFDLITLLNRLGWLAEKEAAAQDKGPARLSYNQNVFGFIKGIPDLENIQSWSARDFFARKKSLQILLARSFAAGSLRNVKPEDQASLFSLSARLDLDLRDYLKKELPKPNREQTRILKMISRAENLALRGYSVTTLSPSPDPEEDEMLAGQVGIFAKNIAAVSGLAPHLWAILTLAHEWGLNQLIFTEGGVIGVKMADQEDVNPKFHLAAWDAGPGIPDPNALVALSFYRRQTDPYHFVRNGGKFFRSAIPIPGDVQIESFGHAWQRQPNGLYANRRISPILPGEGSRISIQIPYQTAVPLAEGGKIRAEERSVPWSRKIISRQEAENRLRQHNTISEISASEAGLSDALDSLLESNHQAVELNKGTFSKEGLELGATFQKNIEIAKKAINDKGDYAGAYHSLSRNKDSRGNYLKLYLTPDGQTEYRDTMELLSRFLRGEPLSDRKQEEAVREAYEAFEENFYNRLRDFMETLVFSGEKLFTEKGQERLELLEDEINRLAVGYSTLLNIAGNVQVMPSSEVTRNLDSFFPNGGFVSSLFEKYGIYSTELQLKVLEKIQTLVQRSTRPGLRLRPPVQESERRRTEARWYEILKSSGGYEVYEYGRPEPLAKFTNVRALPRGGSLPGYLAVNDYKAVNHPEAARAGYNYLARMAQENGLDYFYANEIVNPRAFNIHRKFVENPEIELSVPEGGPWSAVGAIVNDQTRTRRILIVDMEYGGVERELMLHAPRDAPAKITDVDGRELPVDANGKYHFESGNYVYQVWINEAREIHVSSAEMKPDVDRKGSFARRVYSLSVQYYVPLNERGPQVPFMELAHLVDPRTGTGSVRFGAIASPGTSIQIRAEKNPRGGWNIDFNPKHTVTGDIPVDIGMDEKYFLEAYKPGSGLTETEDRLLMVYDSPKWLRGRPKPDPDMPMAMLRPDVSLLFRKVNSAAQLTESFRDALLSLIPKSFVPENPEHVFWRVEGETVSPESYPDDALILTLENGTLPGQNQPRFLNLRAGTPARDGQFGAVRLAVPDNRFEHQLLIEHADLEDFTSWFQSALQPFAQRVGFGYLFLPERPDGNSFRGVTQEVLTRLGFRQTDTYRTPPPPGGWEFYNAARTSHPTVPLRVWQKQFSSGPAAVVSVDVSPFNYGIYIAIDERQQDRLSIDRDSGTFSYRREDGSLLTDPKAIVKNIETDSDMLRRFEREHPGLSVVAAVDNASLFSNQGFVTFADGKLFHTVGENFEARAYTSLVIWKQSKVTMEEVHYKKNQEGAIEVWIDGRNVTDQIDYATFGQFLLDGQGHPRADFETIIPQFQDLRHVYRFPKIRAADLPELPALPLVSQPEIFYGISQLAANDYAIARQAWSRPVELEMTAQIRVRLPDGNTEPRTMPVPENLLRPALIAVGYEEASGQVSSQGQFKIENGRLQIFLKPGVYPRTLVGVTSDRKLKILGIGGKSGSQGATVKESAEFAAANGFQQVMLLDHGGSAKVFAEGGYVLPSSEGRYHRTSALLITAGRRRGEMRDLSSETDAPAQARKDFDFSKWLGTVNRDPRMDEDRIRTYLKELRPQFSNDGDVIARLIPSGFLGLAAKEAGNKEFLFFELLQTAALYILDRELESPQNQTRLEGVLESFSKLIDLYNQSYSGNPQMSVSLSMILPLSIHFEESEEAQFIKYRGRLHLLPGKYGREAAAFDLIVTGMHLRGETVLSDTVDIDRVLPNLKFVLETLEQEGLEDSEKNYLKFGVLKLILTLHPFLVDPESWDLEDPEDPFYYFSPMIDHPEAQKDVFWNHSRMRDIRQLVKAHRALVQGILKEFLAQPLEFRQQVVALQFYFFTGYYRSLRDNDITANLEESLKKFINGDPSALPNLPSLLRSEIEISSQPAPVIMLDQLSQREQAEYVRKINLQLQLLSQNPDAIFINRQEARAGILTKELLEAKISELGFSHLSVGELHGFAVSWDRDDAKDAYDRRTANAQLTQVMHALSAYRKNYNISVNQDSSLPDAEPILLITPRFSKPRKPFYAPQKKRFGPYRRGEMRLENNGIEPLMKKINDALGSFSDSLKFIYTVSYEFKTLEQARETGKPARWMERYQTRGLVPADVRKVPDRRIQGRSIQEIQLWLDPENLPDAGSLLSLIEGNIEGFEGKPLASVDVRGQWKQLRNQEENVPVPDNTAPGKYLWAPRHVLIFENTQTMLDKVTLALQQQGGVTSENTDVFPSVESFEEGHPADDYDLILVDNHLDGAKPGSSLLKNLRERYPKAVIVLNTKDAHIRDRYRRGEFPEADYSVRDKSKWDISGIVYYRDISEAGAKYRSEKRTEEAPIRRNPAARDRNAAEIIARYFTGFLILTSVKESYGDKVFEEMVQKLLVKNSPFEAPGAADVPQEVKAFFESENGNLLRGLFVPDQLPQEPERVIHLRDTDRIFAEGISTLGVEILYTILNSKMEYILIAENQEKSDQLLNLAREYASRKLHLKLGSNFKVVAAVNGDRITAVKTQIRKDIETVIITDGEEAQSFREGIESLPVFEGAKVIRLVDDAHLTDAQELLLGAELLKATNEQISRMVQFASKHIDGRFSGLMAQIQAFSKFLQAA